MGPPGPRGKKTDFFRKLFLDDLGCSNKCFSPMLSPFWAMENLKMP